MKLTSWQDVQQEVLARIHSRQWKPGELIPKETDLSREFGCARATVNRALRSLAEDGLLERRRKVGTRVVANPVRRAVLDIPVIRLEIESRGQRYGYELLEIDRSPAPPKIRARHALRPDTELLTLKALHLADGTPYVVEDRWVNLETVPGILEADLTRISANEWLVANAPFTKGDVAFCAVNASMRESRLLKVAPDSALFVIERTTWDRARAVTAVRLVFAPGFRIRTEI